MADEEKVEKTAEERKKLIAERFNEVIAAAKDGFLKEQDINTIYVAFEDVEPMAVDKLVFAELLADDEALYEKFKAALEQEKRHREVVANGNPFKERIRKKAT